MERMKSICIKSCKFNSSDAVVYLIPVGLHILRHFDFWRQIVDYIRDRKSFQHSNSSCNIISITHWNSWSHPTTAFQYYVIKVLQEKMMLYHIIVNSWRKKSFNQGICKCRSIIHRIRFMLLNYRTIVKWSLMLSMRNIEFLWKE